MPSERRKLSDLLLLAVCCITLCVCSVGIISRCKGASPDREADTRRAVEHAEALQAHIDSLDKVAARKSKVADSSHRTRTKNPQRKSSKSKGDSKRSTPPAYHRNHLDEKFDPVTGELRKDE